MKQGRQGHRIPEGGGDDMQPGGGRGGEWLSWRPAEPFEADVIKRAYAQRLAADSETLKVAGR